MPQAEGGVGCSAHSQGAILCHVAGSWSCFSRMCDEALGDNSLLWRLLTLGSTRCQHQSNNVKLRD